VEGRSGAHLNRRIESTKNRSVDSGGIVAVEVEESPADCEEKGRVHLEKRSMTLQQVKRISTHGKANGQPCRIKISKRKDDGVGNEDLKNPKKKRIKSKSVKRTKGRGRKHKGLPPRKREGESPFSCLTYVKGFWGAPENKTTDEGGEI